jgi:hypothetical protein
MENPSETHTKADTRLVFVSLRILTKSSLGAFGITRGKEKGTGIYLVTKLAFSLHRHRGCRCIALKGFAS